MKVYDIINEDGKIVPGVNTTVDVKPGETERQAKKFFGGNGKPKPLGVKGASPNQAYNLGLVEEAAVAFYENISHTAKRVRDTEKKRDVKIGSEEWFKLWFSLPYLKEGVLSEAYKMQLERADDMYILHILDTKTNQRTEVRGSKGYESGGYDSDDRLHKLLDVIGKSANISELMNGEVVTINPKHPDAEKAKAATDTAFNENVSALQAELEQKYNLKSLFLADMGKRNAIELHSIIVNKEEQGSGTGSKVMQEIIAYADANDKIVVLDPGLLDKKHGTTSQSRLRKFYKRFGFIDNKGRNKNYEFRNLMIRYPQSNESVNEGTKE